MWLNRRGHGGLTPTETLLGWVFLWPVGLLCRMTNDLNWTVAVVGALLCCVWRSILLTGVGAAGWEVISRVWAALFPPRKEDGDGRNL